MQRKATTRATCSHAENKKEGKRKLNREKGYERLYERKNGYKDATAVGKGKQK